MIENHFLQRVFISIVIIVQITGIICIVSVVCVLTIAFYLFGQLAFRQQFTYCLYR